MAAGGSVDILMVRGAGVSDIPAGVSDMPAGASDMPAGVSDMPAGVSDMPAGVSDIPADYNRLHGVICHALKLLYSHRENRKSVIRRVI